MRWSKVVILSGLFLILMSIVFAETNVDIPETSVYNLGEMIPASVSIIESEGHNGFLKVMIDCETYDLQYYTTPLNLEANFRTQIQVPELPLYDSMEGGCYIKAEFEDSSGDEISRGDSKTFTVTKELNISTDGIINVLPNEDVILEGTVRKINGEELQSGDVKISFMNKEHDAKVEFGRFEYSLSIDSDLDIGNYPLVISAEDKNKNYADVLVQVTVLPIATRIENRLESQSIRPGKELIAKIILYDHKDMAMNGTMKVDLLDIEGNILISKLVESLDSINYDFSRNTLPGVYSIISEIDDIRQETRFEVEAVEEISMSQENEAVIVENIGNVDYDRETTIVLESEDKKYLINKKIKLTPGEIITIDLSKEVPSGTYDVILPQAEVNAEEGTVESVDSGESVPDEGSGNVIEDVVISDNRPLYKKAGSGFSQITGIVVGIEGYITSKPLLSSILLIIIVLTIVLYYSKDAIMNKIRKKKPQDTDKLFEGYDYKNEDEDDEDS